MKTIDHNQKGYSLNTGNHQVMKRIKVASVVTMIMGVLSVIAVLFTYLALCDIGNQELDLTMEWNMVGIGLMIWIVFIVSTMITLTYLNKNLP